MIFIYFVTLHIKEFYENGNFGKFEYCISMLCVVRVVRRFSVTFQTINFNVLKHKHDLTRKLKKTQNLFKVKWVIISGQL